MNAFTDKLQKDLMNSILQQEIIQHLEAETTKSGWTISHKSIESRECQIYKASCDNYHHDIAIKVYRKGFSLSIDQYTAMENSADILNQPNSKYRVPQCYGYLTHQKIYMMEWINAPTLQYRLLRFCYHNKKQQNDMARAFIWLKKYHLRHGELKRKSVDIDWYLKDLQNYIQKLDPDRQLQKDDIFIKGLAAIKSKATLFNNFSVPFAAPHNDFTPSNILMDDNITTGIDLHDAPLKPICNELALQLSYLSTGYINMLTKRHMKKPPQEWEILNTVLNAYDYPTDSQQRNFFLYVFLYQLLRRWLVVFERNKSRRTPVLDIWSLQNKKKVVDGVSQVLINIPEANNDTKD